MKKLKISILWFVISLVLVISLSIFIFDLTISDVIAISILLFLIAGVILSKGYLIGNLIGIIPAIVYTYLGLQENGQWINEITFAIPIYLFYTICFIAMLIIKIRNRKKKINIQA